MNELSGKQRRFLRALGNGIKPKVFVGKSGLCETLVQSLNDSFNNDELVKIRIEKSCNLERKEVAKGKADYSNAEAAVKSGAAVVASTQQFIEDQNNQMQQDASRLGADFNASGGDFGLGTKSEVTDAVKAKLQELDSALTAFESGSGKSGSLSSGSYSQLQSIAKQIDSAISQDDGADKAYTRAWDQSRQHAAKLMDRYQAVKLRDEQEMPISMEEVEGQLESSELKHNASFYGWALWAALGRRRGALQDS